MECVAVLDVPPTQALTAPELGTQGKALAVGIVSMLGKMCR